MLFVCDCESCVLPFQKKQAQNTHHKISKFHFISGFSFTTWAPVVIFRNGSHYGSFYFHTTVWFCHCVFLCSPIVYTSCENEILINVLGFLLPLFSWFVKFCQHFFQMSINVFFCLIKLSITFLDLSEFFITLSTSDWVGENCIIIGVAFW